MAKRILPYRDYSEHDVVNLFSLDLSAATSTTLAGMVPGVTGGDFDAGVVVSVSAGTLPGEVSELRAESTDALRGYLGASFSTAHIGFNGYPANTGMTVVPANEGATSRGLGITLRETLAFDENGEKMLYYKQKLDEAQAVLPGQTVPVLTRGLVLLDSSAFDAYDHDGDGGITPEVKNITIGARIYVGPGGTLSTEESGDPVGSVVAKSGTDKVLCRISF